MKTLDICFSAHPYLFFNHDKTFTFIGFNIDKATGNVVDENTKKVLLNNVVSENLRYALERNHVPLAEKLSLLNRYL